MARLGLRQHAAAAVSASLNRDARETASARCAAGAGAAAS
jgi:hypothetical protein